MLKEKSSFRDPSGEVYIMGNDIYRRINACYFKDYDRLMQSGLYQELVNRKLIISHDEIGRNYEAILIQPEKVSFISYPYEWCFSMLRDAALSTLKINQIALESGMVLKDAPAYNMQYYNGRMVLIDTLSFMEYQDGQPWGAYRQFLQHFLYPLLLMAYYNPYCSRWSQIHLDGIPAGFAIHNLPWYLWFNPSLWAHLYAQNWNIQLKGQETLKMSKYSMMALLYNLESTIRGIKYQGISDWVQYKDARSYTDLSQSDKDGIVSNLLRKYNGIICDLGANTGRYSEIATDLFCYKVISVDSDHDCIEHIYNSMKCLPLVVDLCNPTPAIGWENTERRSFMDRLHADTLLALAIIHHLCVGNNVPLSRVAEMVSKHCKNLIIEFVPLEDPKAQQLLGKKNIPPYSLEIFKASFSEYFNITGEYPIKDSLRIIYSMERR
jgi:hypothetical protein